MTDTAVPSFYLLIACTHRWVRDTAVSALPLNGTTLVSGVAIPAPTAYLSLAPLLLFLFGDSSSGTSSTCRGSGGIRRGGTTSTTKIHSPRGCCSCRGHGVVRGKGALRACAHPWTAQPSALRLPYRSPTNSPTPAAYPGARSTRIVRMDARFRRCRVRFLRRGRRPTRAACEGGAPTAPPPPAASGRSLGSLHFVNV